MKTSLEKGKAQRLRVSELYESGWQFVVRLLMGLGIYVILRILLISMFVNKAGIPFYLTNSLMELIILIITAVLMVIYPWIKIARLRFVTSVWMPVMGCLSIAGWLHMILTLTRIGPVDALFGILPFVLPLTLFVLFWMFPPAGGIMKIIAGGIFAILCAFWAVDLPRTMDVLRDVHPVISAYREFHAALAKEHLISGETAPEKNISGRVSSVWEYKDVDPADYRIDPEIPAIRRLAYVSAVNIMIPALREGKKDSYQELRFSTLETVDLHYLYKYTTRRVIAVKDFQFSGDAFFRAVLADGRTMFLDNVVIRKK